jgi:hypothetical protein
MASFYWFKGKKKKKKKGEEIGKEGEELNKK